MEHIGYSVVDVENNEEIWFAGDTWQRCPGFPAFINVPNLGQVHCPTLNETYSGYKLVMRFIEDGSKEYWGASITQS